MDIDERLGRLRERHEALTGSVELLRLTLQEQSGIVAKQAETAAKQSETIDKILTAINKDSQNIAALARIAESHDRRISQLEG